MAMSLFSFVYPLPLFHVPATLKEAGTCILVFRISKFMAGSKVLTGGFEITCDLTGQRNLLVLIGPMKGLRTRIWIVSPSAKKGTDPLWGSYREWLEKHTD